MTEDAKELPFNQTLFNIDKTLTAVARHTKENYKQIAILTSLVVTQGEYITKQQTIAAIKKERFNMWLKMLTGASLIMSMFYGAYSLKPAAMISKLDAVYIQKEEKKERRPLIK